MLHQHIPIGLRGICDLVCGAGDATYFAEDGTRVTYQAF